MNKTIILFFVAFINVAAVPTPAIDDVNIFRTKVKDVDSTTTMDNDFSSTTVDGQTTTTTSSGISKGCKLCMGFVEGLEAVIGTEEGNIEQEANDVCDSITMGNGWADSLCKEIIDELLEEIVKAIKNSETPQKICTDIVGMCNA
uniref:Saposin B-type domain-containing protein n=1 Tax=Panagrolaimus davidi TaxID=227884 RepID=A0A914P3Q9_9BILA